ncbi:hypothetical protein VN0949_10810 [Helicobacter pylori]
MVAIKEPRGLGLIHNQVMLQYIKFNFNIAIPFKEAYTNTDQ